MAENTDGGWYDSRDDLVGGTDNQWTDQNFRNFDLRTDRPTYEPKREFSGKISQASLAKTASYDDGPRDQPPYGQGGVNPQSPQQFVPFTVVEHDNPGGVTGPRDGSTPGSSPISTDGQSYQERMSFTGFNVVESDDSAGTYSYPAGTHEDSNPFAGVPVFGGVADKE